MNILITGTYRSSTTLLGRILDASEEVQIFTDSTCYTRFHGFKFEDKVGILSEILDRVKKRRDFTMSKNCYEKILNKRHTNASDLWFDILNHLNVRNKKKYCGEKVVLEWRNIETFLSQNQLNKSLHTIRDPRSVLVSWKKMTNAKPPRYVDSIFNCIDSMKTALDLKSKFDKNKYMIFQYEKFLSNPKSYMEEVCEPFGIKYSDEMLNNDNWRIDGKKYTSSSMHGKIKEISDAKKKSWKDFITKEEEFFFNKIFPDDLLAAFQLEKKREISMSDIKQERIKEFFEDSLISSGIMDWFMFNRGQSRFPSDFRDSSTWMELFYE